MSDRLDRAVEREESALEDDFSSGAMSVEEYNRAMRDLHESAREEERSENNYWEQRGYERY